MDQGYLVSNDILGPSVFESFPCTPEGLEGALRQAERLLGQEVSYEVEGPQGFVRNFGPCRRAYVWERRGRRLLYTLPDGSAPDAFERSRPSGLAEDADVVERLCA